MKMLLDIVRDADRWLPLGPQKYLASLLATEQWRERMMDGVRECVPFVISNVAAYFYQGTPQEEWDIFADFPKTAPPFRWTWFEWNMPSTVNSLGSVEHLKLNSITRRAGAIVTWDKAEDDAVLRLQPEAAYRMNIVPFIEGPYERRPFVMATCAFGLNALYDPIPARQGKNELIYAFNGMDRNHLNGNSQDAIDLGTQSCVTMYPALLALSMLNCRNVTVKTVSPNAALIHKHRKRGHAPPAPYNIIEIQPMVTQIRKETGLSGYSRRAASIVRGHFKDYRNGGGLFGKLHGLYWWDQQMQGKNAIYAMKERVGPLSPQWVKQHEAARSAR